MESGQPKGGQLACGVHLISSSSSHVPPRPIMHVQNVPFFLHCCMLAGLILQLSCSIALTSPTSVTLLQRSSLTLCRLVTSRFRTQLYVAVRTAAIAWCMLPPLLNLAHSLAGCVGITLRQASASAVEGSSATSLGMQPAPVHHR
jgi:hypothetical protein